MCAKETKEREPCPQCIAVKGSTTRNNLTVYEDGKYCQACGYYEKLTTTTRPLLAGTITSISERGLTLDACQKYNIRTTGYTGKLNGEYVVNEKVYLLPFYKDGHVVRQKIRSAVEKKRMSQSGDTTFNMLFGENLFNPSKQISVIVTEGEFDAVAAYQMTGIPSVSITNGSNNAMKELSQKITYLSGFRDILFVFDMDDAGQSALDDCVGLFEPGLARTVTLPLKDANEMLLAGKEKEFTKCLVNAKAAKPSTIVFPGEISDQILAKPQYGMPWPWPFMTNVTYGMRLGEVYIWAGPESVGKTETMYKIVAYYVNQGNKAALFDFERQPDQTMRRVIASIVGERIYLPNCSVFDEAKISEQIERLKDSIALYRWGSGKLSLDSILINIRYLYKCYNITFFVIDNLTALSVNSTAGMKDYEYASQVVGELVQISKELNITIFIINHLAKDKIMLNASLDTPEDFEYNTHRSGLTWASGRMADSENIYGGGKVVKLADYVIVLARNRMSQDDLVKRTLVVKFLKTRYESSLENTEYKLVYDRQTGNYFELKDIGEENDK